MDLEQLKQKRGELFEQIKAHAVNRGKWTAADREKWTALNAEIEATDKAIADAEKAQNEAEAERKAMLDRITVLEGRKPQASGGRPNFGSDGGSLEAGPKLKRTFDEEGRLSGEFEITDETAEIVQTTGPNTSCRLSYKQQKRTNNKLLRNSGYKPLGYGGEFKSFRDFVRAGLDGHQTSAFRERVNKHYNAVAGMSEGVGADGGFTVMPEFASGIIDRVYQNDLFGRMDVYNVTGNNLTFVCNAETSRAAGSRHGGMRGYWIPEGGTLTATKPTMRAVSLKLLKLGVLVYLTQELIDDMGLALDEYATRKASQEFNFMLGDAAVNGTGAGQPTGMLNTPSLVSVAKESGQLATSLETENIEKMFARFYMPNYSNAIWLHNQDILPELNTMTLGVGTGGVPTYMPPGGQSAAPYGVLKGRPLVPTEFNATLGTQGDIILADLGQMLAITKGGIAQAVSMHVQFLSDQMALRFIMRVNFGAWDVAPITPYKGSNTQSNFVTLDAR